MAVNTYSLITLDNVKLFIGLSNSTSDVDDLIEDLIDRISTSFETYCDRKFLSREYTEYYDGVGEDKLFVDQYPIITISGIWDDRDWGWASDTIVDSDYYRISNNGWFVVFNNTVLLDYQQNVKIAYTAGYSTIPDDLKQACIEEVARTYKNKNQIDISSKTLIDGSVSYVVTDFLPKTLTILNKYKKVIII